MTVVMFLQCHHKIQTLQLWSRYFSMASGLYCQNTKHDTSMTELLRSKTDVERPTDDERQNLFTRNAACLLKTTLALKDRAQRSVLIEHEGKGIDGLVSMCKRYGYIEDMEQVSPKRVIVEFSTLHSVRSMKSTDLADGEFLGNTRVMRCKDYKGHPAISNKQQNTLDMFESSGSDSLGHFVDGVFHASSTTECQLKLNYLQCEMIEDLFRGIMPECCVLPYGSTLSTLCTQGGDLDLVFHPTGLSHYRPSCAKPRKSYDQFHSVLDSRPDIKYDSLKRELIQYISFSLKYFAYDCKRILPLVGARIPITRFNSGITSNRCDIAVSFRRNDGVLASLMLRRFCECNETFRRLSHCLRYWAMQRNLTSMKAGGYITNFTLSHLLIFFLQQKGVLPSVEKLLKANGDVEIVQNSLNHDVDLDVLGDLYMEFFAYWSNFDYSNAIDIYYATTVKAAYLPSYHFGEQCRFKIIYSLHPEMNIAKNTSQKYHYSFVSGCKETHKMLQQNKFIGAHIKR